MFIMAVYFVAMGMAFEFMCSLSAVLLHECAHAKAAKKLGYALNEIKLMPYGAALCGNADIRPKHEIIIAVAGPLFNLVLATAFAALWWLVPESYIFTQAFCKCNLCIGLFNLLPVYPLDGGRIILALLTFRLKRACAYKFMRIFSAVIGIAVTVLFAVSAVYTPNLCLLSIGLFMTASALVPDRRAQYTALFAMGSRRDRLKTPLEVKRFAVSETASLAVLCGALDPEKYSEFTVLAEDSLTERGTISETKLIAAVKANGYETKAGNVVNN